MRYLKQGMVLQLVFILVTTTLSHGSQREYKFNADLSTSPTSRRLLQNERDFVCQLEVCDHVPCKFNQLPQLTQLSRQSIFDFVLCFRNLQRMAIILDSQILNKDTRSQITDVDLQATILIPSDKSMDAFYELKGLTEEEVILDEGLVNQLVNQMIIPFSNIKQPEDGSDLSVTTLMEGQRVVVKFGGEAWKVYVETKPDVVANITSRIGFNRMNVTSTQGLKVWVIDQVLPLLETEDIDLENSTPKPIPIPTPTPFPQVCESLPCSQTNILTYELQDFVEFLSTFENMHIFSSILRTELFKQLNVSGDGFIGIVFAPSDTAFRKARFASVDELEENEIVLTKILNVHFAKLPDILRPGSDQVSVLNALYSDDQIEFVLGKDGAYKVKGEENREFINVTSRITLGNSFFLKNGYVNIWVIDGVLRGKEVIQFDPVFVRPSEKLTKEKGKEKVEEEEEGEFDYSVCTSVGSAVNVLNFTTEFDEFINSDLVSEEVQQVLVNQTSSVILLVPVDGAFAVALKNTSIQKKDILNQPELVNKILASHIIILENGDLDKIVGSFQTMFGSSNVTFIFDAVSLRKVESSGVNNAAFVSAVVNPCPTKSYVIFIDRVLLDLSDLDLCPQSVRQQIIPGLVPDCASMPSKFRHCYEQCTSMRLQNEDPSNLESAVLGPIIEDDICQCAINGLICSQQCSAS